MNKIMKTVVSMVLMIAVAVCSLNLAVSASDTDDTSFVARFAVTLLDYKAHREQYNKLYNWGGSFAFPPDITTIDKAHGHGEGSVMPNPDDCSHCKNRSKYTYIYDYVVLGTDYIRYRRLWTSTPLVIASDGKVNWGNNDMSYMRSADGVSVNMINPNNNVPFNFQVTGNPLPVSGQVVVCPTMYSGFVDEAGNVVDIGNGVDTGNLFDKPYYSLTEYNSLLDTMGEQYASKKLSTKGELMGAGKLNSALVKGDFGAKTDIEATNFALGGFCNSNKVKVYNTGFWAIDKNMKAYYYQVISDTPIRFEINDKNSLVAKHGAIIYFNEQNASCNLVAVLKPNGRYNNVVLVDHVTKKIENYEVFKDWDGGQKVLQTGMTFVVDDGTTTSDRLPGQDTGDGTIDDGNGGEITVGGGTGAGGGLDMPSKPGAGGTITDWLGYIFECIFTLIDYVIKQFKYIFGQLVGFWQIVRDLFFFFPKQIVDLMGLAILVSIILSFIKR